MYLLHLLPRHASSLGKLKTTASLVNKPPSIVLLVVNLLTTYFESFKDLLSHMSRSIILLLVLLLAASCSQKTIGYYQFYDDYKEEATLALGIPSWASIPVLEKEDIALIQDLTKPTSSVKLMFDERPAISQQFGKYAADQNYSYHQYLKSDSTLVDIYTLVDGEELHEIILSIPSEDGTSLVGILGSLDHDKFLDRIKRQ